MAITAGIFSISIVLTFSKVILTFSLTTWKTYQQLVSHKTNSSAKITAASTTAICSRSALKLTGLNTCVHAVMHSSQPLLYIMNNKPSSSPNKERVRKMEKDRAKGCEPRWRQTISTETKSSIVEQKQLRTPETFPRSHTGFRVSLPSCTAWNGLLGSMSLMECVIFSLCRMSSLRLRSDTASWNTSSSRTAFSSKMAPEEITEVIC